MFSVWRARRIPRPGPDGGRGVPQPGQGRGYLGYPPGQVRMGAIPAWGYPGTPRPGQDWGYPGYPPPRPRSGQRVGGTPQDQVRTGGIPPLPRDRTAHGVLDKRRSVCLLRSRRRTFLFGESKSENFL